MNAIVVRIGINIGRYAVAFLLVTNIYSKTIGTALGVEKNAVKSSPGVKFRKDSSGLTSEQLNRIKKRLASSGISRTLPAKLTVALGATAGDEQLNVREISFERDGFQHGFLQSANFGDGRVILLFRTPEKNWLAFLTNASFDLVSAAAWDSSELPKALTIEEAKEAFEHELLYWATLSEIL